MPSLRRTRTIPFRRTDVLEDEEEEEGEEEDEEDEDVCGNVFVLVVVLVVAGRTTVERPWHPHPW